MAKRKRATGWARLLNGTGVAGRLKRTSPAVSLGKLFTRQAKALSKLALTAGRRAAAQMPERRRAPRSGGGGGDWIAGLALGPGSARRYHLHRPTALATPAAGTRPPLMVMLHGCGQDGRRFAASTRMNAIAAREGFLVLYPEQDRLANAQGCWNWFETRSGRAQIEIALILAAIDQACLLYGADRERVAICGLSAGASMAALVAARHPERFRAVVMHSGVAPGVAQSSATAIAAMQGLRKGAATAVGRPSTQLRAAAGAQAETPALPPLLAIQGLRDGMVAATNARAAVLAWTQAQDGAAVRESAARVVQRGRRHPMHVIDFRRGRETLATLVEIERLGHAWSGGAASQPFGDPAGPDASRLAWAFVAKRLRTAA